MVDGPNSEPLDVLRWGDTDGRRAQRGGGQQELGGLSVCTPFRDFFFRTRLYSTVPDPVARSISELNAATLFEHADANLRPSVEKHIRRTPFPANKTSKRLFYHVNDQRGYCSTSSRSLTLTKQNEIATTLLTPYTVLYHVLTHLCILCVEPRPDRLPSLGIFPLRAQSSPATPSSVGSVARTAASRSATTLGPPAAPSSSGFLVTLTMLCSQRLDAAGVPAEALPRLFVVPHVAVIKRHLGRNPPKHSVCVWGGVGGGGAKAKEVSVETEPFNSPES